jgi:hypothetical protein
VDFRRRVAAGTSPPAPRTAPRRPGAPPTARVGFGDLRGNDQAEVLGVTGRAAAPVHPAHQRDLAVDYHAFGVGYPHPSIDPYRSSRLRERIQAAPAPAGRRPVRNQPDVDAALCRADQGLEDAGAGRQAIGAGQDLTPGAVDSVRREGVAVLLGRKARRNRHPGVTDAAGSAGDSALKASVIAA